MTLYHPMTYDFSVAHCLGTAQEGHSVHHILPSDDLCFFRCTLFRHCSRRPFRAWHCTIPWLMFFPLHIVYALLKKAIQGMTLYHPMTYVFSVAHCLGTAQEGHSGHHIVPSHDLCFFRCTLFRHCSRRPFRAWHCTIPWLMIFPLHIV